MHANTVLCKGRYVKCIYTATAILDSYAVILAVIISYQNFQVYCYSWRIHELDKTHIVVTMVLITFYFYWGSKRFILSYHLLEKFQNLLGYYVKMDLLRN